MSMTNTCHHCHQPTLGELVCTLTGNCYICEHPDWFRQEYARNIQRDFHGDPMRRSMSPEQEEAVLSRLQALFPGCKPRRPWLVATYAQLRYRNAEWGVELRDGRQVYSIISLSECLQYSAWEYGCANEANHVAVWPKYPFEGHHANAR